MNDSSKLILGMILTVMSVFSNLASAATSADSTTSSTTTFYATTSLDGTSGGCPPGFSPIPSGLACAADNLTIEPTTEPSTTGDCPRGFEHVAGVRFCVATNLTIEIPEGMMLLDAIKDGDCPANFSRPVGSTICVADNLVLDNVDQEVKLVKFTGMCPEGFYRPYGVRFCVPKNITTTQLELPNASDCPPGFIRPPGVRFCVASNILDAGDELRNPLAAPIGDCPEGWVKAPNGFCIPQNKTAGCTDECGQFDFNLIKVENTLKTGNDQSCGRDEYDMWWDMPVFDEKGHTIIGFVKTKSCAAQSITYMPQSAK